METECDIWDINVDNITEKIKGVMKTSGVTYLLNMNNKNKDILELYLHSIAKNMFKQMNIDDTENYFVEFWWKNKATHAFHVDCDEELKNNESKYVHPLLSCVNYLNDNVNPIIITNINVEQFTYKDFDNGSISLVFPQKNTLLTFYGGNYHGVVNITNKEPNNNEDRYVIAINIWKDRPHNVEYYQNNESEIINDNILVSFDKIDIVRRKKMINKIMVHDDILNYDFFDNILYKTQLFQPDLFKIINTNTTFDCSKVYIFEKKLKEDQIISKQKNVEIVIQDIEDINNDNKNNISFKNRFLQRFNVKQFLTDDICNFILHEVTIYANEHGWTTLRHANYPTTDLPIISMQNIFPFIKSITIQSIFALIKKKYRLPDFIELEIKDLFIVKYSIDTQNKLNLHKDGSFFSFNILLNNVSDFEGGGTYFEDGLIYNSEKGELMIHCGKIRHAGFPITMGERYLLVGFINVNI